MTTKLVGYIQLEPFVAGDGTTPDRGITNEEIVSGLLQSGGVNFAIRHGTGCLDHRLLDTVDTIAMSLGLEDPQGC